MAQTQPRIIYGLNSAILYSRTTGLAYGELRVLKGSSVSLTAELQEQMGGAQKYSWAAEEGGITSELSLNVGELPNFLFELFLGNAPTAATAQTSGSISTLTDKYGTTIQDNTNGVASVYLLSGSSANLKFGKYVVLAATASTFDLYYSTSIDLARGTDGAHISDTLCVASGVAFTASVASVPAFGVAFAQIGTPAFTVGNTATFEVLPVNSKSSSVVIGGINTTFPEYGTLIYTQKRGNGEMLEIDLYRCKSAGMPLPAEAAAFANFEIKAKVLYDSDLDGAFKIRHVSP